VILMGHLHRAGLLDVSSVRSVVPRVQSTRSREVGDAGQGTQTAASWAKTTRRGSNARIRFIQGLAPGSGAL